MLINGGIIILNLSNSQLEFTIDIYMYAYNITSVRLLFTFIQMQLLTSQNLIILKVQELYQYLDEKFGNSRQYFTYKFICQSLLASMYMYHSTRNETTLNPNT